MIQRIGVSKLLLAFTLGLAVAIMATGGSVFSIATRNLDEISRAMKDIQARDAFQTNLITDIASAQARLNGILSESDIDALEKKVQSMQTSFQSINKNLASCGEDCAGFKGPIESYQASYSRIVNDLVLVGKKGEAVEASIQELSPRFDSVLAAFDSKRKEDAQRTENMISESRKSNQRLRALLLAMIIGVPAILLTAGVGFRHVLIRQMKTFQGKLSGGSTEVSSVSTHLQDAGRSLSEGSSTQAAAVQQTMAAVDQIQATLKKSADYAKSSIDSAQRGQDDISRTKTSLDELSGTIREVDASNAAVVEQIQASNLQLAEIVKVIGEIGAKTQVINDIVFQTKLLAFNASVEAARAGEAGKGFAVVAQEVGNLAQMSGNSAVEITDLLSESTRTVEKIVQENRAKFEELVEASRRNIAASVEKVQVCERTLTTVLGSSERLSQMIQEISTATREQARSVDEVATAMRQIDDFSNRNATTSQEAAKMADQLATQSRTLHGMVSDLGTLLWGNSGPA